MALRVGRRGSGGAVLRRGEAGTVHTWKPGHYFYELLVWQTLALVSCLQWLLEQFLAVFDVKVHTNPKVDSHFALENLNLFYEPLIWQSGFWTNFTHCPREGEFAS